MNTPATPAAANPGRELLKSLQTEFTVFRECKPLAIGIDSQIMKLKPEIEKKVLRAALRSHTNSTRYLKAMEKATVRFDLEGKEADPVSDEHRARASELLKERFRKQAEERRAQQAEAEAARKRAEKLEQLASKFSRR